MVYILAFDAGTSAVKAVIMGADGRIVATADAQYPLLTPHPGWAEQEPDAYWRAVCDTARRARAAAGVPADAIAGLAFATQWKGVLPVGKDGKPLGNNILWLDARAGEQAARLKAAMGCFVGTGSQYWPRLMWLKENRRNLYDRAYCILEVNSYLKLCATGEYSMDETNCFVRAGDAQLQAYYDRILAAAGIDMEKFPPMTAATQQAGRLTEHAAQEMSLAAGTPVFGGCGDIPAVAVGAGCAGLGREHLYLGSSGWVCRVDERPALSGEFLYQALCADRFCTVSGIQSACMTQNWAISTLYPLEERALGRGVFDFLEREAARVPPGSVGLLATPWLHGETAPCSPDARATFVNMSGAHTRAHLFAAMREGVCYHLRFRRKLLDVPGGMGGTVRVVGGGAASAHWMQCLADILQAEVEIPLQARNVGAMGAAACAAVGLGWWSSLEDADARVGAVRRYHPRTAFAARYDGLFAAFEQVYPALKGLYKRLREGEEV